MRSVMAKMNTSLSSLFFLGLITMHLGGCNSFSKLTSSREVVLPSTPPIASENLERIVGTCKKEVDNLTQQAAYVHPERQKEFNMVLDMAQENCADMTDTFERLKAATYQEQ